MAGRFGGDGSAASPVVTGWAGGLGVSPIVTGAGSVIGSASEAGGAPSLAEGLGRGTDLAPIVTTGLGLGGASAGGEAGPDVTGSAAESQPAARSGSLPDLATIPSGG